MGLNQLTDPRMLRAREEKFAQLMKASLAPNTIRNYTNSLKKFMAKGADLPCSPQDIINYLVERAGNDSATELAHMVKSLRFIHKLNNFVDPTDNARVRQIMQGIARKYGKPAVKAKPLTKEDILKIREYLLNEEHDFYALRNIALILVGFFGALRVSELVKMEHRHITINEDGMVILIPTSKTDQTNQGQTVYLPRLKHAWCPVNALEEWLDTSKIAKNYIFPAIYGPLNTKTDSSKHLSSHAFNCLLKKLAVIVGLPDPEKYSSHSLRRGFATEAAKKGVSLFVIQKHGRWESIRNVANYVDAGAGFTDNATLAFDD